MKARPFYTTGAAFVCVVVFTLGCGACGAPDDPFAGQDIGVSGDTGAVDVPDDTTPAAPVVGDACQTGDNCVAGWMCEIPAGATTQACVCRPEEERPNTVDDDCDGIIDEGFQRIAFWNVRDLSANSRDPEELSLIADVIEVYGLVALAEVNDELVVPELEAILDGRGNAWSSFTSAQSGNSSASAERYAIIWREDSFAFDPPRILGDVTRPDGEPFGRDPMLAIGRSLGGGFDFALLVVHITWGDGEEERIAEVRAMADFVSQARAFDPDVLVAGDMNLNSGESQGIAWLEVNAGLISTTAPTPPTKVDSENTYDHLMLDPEATTEYTGVHGVDTFDLFMFPNDAAGASRAVSDHRPVWIAVDVRAADDD